MNVSDARALLNEICLKQEATFVRDFEAVLAELDVKTDPEIIGMLVLYFDDDYEYDELMFSIIHTIEKCDSHTYVKCLLDHCSTLWSRSPRWASILFIRILNSPIDTLELARQVTSSSEDVKGTVKAVMKSIEELDSKFVEKMKPVLNTLS